MLRLHSRARRIAPWLGVLAVTLCALLVRAVLDHEDAADVFDEDIYYGMMATEVAGLDDLVEDYELKQFEFLFIAPPAEWSWVQGGGILPFDPEGFPKDFVAGLVPSTRDGITNYTVYVFEDPDTRERVFANAELKEIAAVDPPEDYDPNWFVDYRYPDMDERGWDEDYIDFITQCYDPARVWIRYSLLPESEVIKHVWRASIQAALWAEGGGYAMMSWQGGSVTNIEFVGSSRCPTASRSQSPTRRASRTRWTCSPARTSRRGGGVSRRPRTRI